MLKRIYIDNYRCFVNFELQLQSRRVIVGVNGSGKSAFLEVLAEIRPCQHAPHCLALNADAATVNNPERFQTKLVSFYDIFFNDAFDIPRWNCVEVEDVVDWYSEGILQNKSSVLRFITADDLLHLVLQVEFDFL